MLTVLVDYDSGNLHSAEKSFQRMALEVDGGDVLVSSQPEDVARADRIVLPGDGAFPACRNALMNDHAGLYEAISDSVISKAKPFMGICVGMQMMASWGREYENVKGFDWIGGEVVKIAPKDASLKVPHMGWNDLILSGTHPVLDGISTGNHAYFVHSYHFKVADLAQRIAHVEYGENITAIIGRDTMIGMQFHPEKSQKTGLQIIANFLRWTP